MVNNMNFVNVTKPSFDEFSKIVFNINNELTLSIEHKDGKIKFILSNVNEMVGVVSVRINNCNDTYGYYIFGLIIIGKYRNKGYGTLLLKKVLDWLIEQNLKLKLGFVYLEITTERRNDKIRFYKRNGFVVDEIQTDMEIMKLSYRF